MMYWTVILLMFFCNSLVYSSDNNNVTSKLVVGKNSSNLLRFAGKTYYFSTVFKGNYFQAMQFCNKHEMRLVSITTKELNDILGKFAEEIGHSFSHFWTSGTNLQDDGSHEWIWLSTGSSFTYTNWYPGEPNKGYGQTPENCVEARTVDNRGFSWNNAPCNFQFNFICESYSLTCDIP